MTNTGEMHVNRLTEEVSWSPDSRFAVRAFQERYDTGQLKLYAFADDTVRTTDLNALTEPTLAAQARKICPRYQDWSYSVVARNKLSVGHSGRIRFIVMMWIPKDGPELYFDVAIEARRRNQGLDARVVSIRRSRTPR